MPFIPDEEQFVPDEGGFIPDDRATQIEGFKLQAEEAKKEASKSVARRFGRELINFGLSAPAKFIASAAEVPQAVFTGKAAQKEYKIPGVDPFKSFISEAETEALAGRHPAKIIGQKAIEVPLAGLETLGLTKLGVSAVKGAKSLFKSRADVRALKEAISVTKPTLTPKEEIAAKATGRVTKTGLGRKVTLEPSERDIEVAEAVKGIVKKGDPFKNIQRIRSNIAKISDDEVREAIRANDSIFNNSQLRTKLNIAKEDSELLFAGDLSKEKAYNAIINRFIQLVNKRGNKTSGLFESRIDFDQLMKQKFGRDILDPTKSKDIIRTNAILDVRRAANEYISELLPEGNAYKALLKKESLMFDAINRLAKSAPKLGTTALQRFGQRHPIVKSTAKLVGGGLVTGGAVYGGLRRLGE